MNDSTQMGGAAYTPTPRGHQPNPHGQAALLLAESILHTLIDKGILSNADAVLTVEIAAEVEDEVSVHNGDSPHSTSEALNLLSAIKQSLSADAEGPKVVR